MANRDRGKSVMPDWSTDDPYDSHNTVSWGDTHEVNIVPSSVPTQESGNPVAPEAPTANIGQLEGGSFIWEHFTKESVGENRFMVKCKHCRSTYKFIQGAGYGTFKRHLQAKHPTQAGLERTQTQISGLARSSSPLFLFSEKKYKEELARFASVEHLAFSFGERFGFNNFIQTACVPQAKPVPRNTLKRQILALYKTGKDELLRFFLNYTGRVHIASDIWSDPWQTHSYMGITCHWIDDDWLIQKRVIAFRVFDSRHTANNIYRVIRQVLEEYALVNKIFSVGFDNAAANTASITELETLCQPSFGGKFFHIRCACHVLNLCVQDGLGILAIYLEPIKVAIQYLWRHPQVMKEWGKFCKLNKRRPKRFPRDVPTRWNSTYELLSQSYDYRELLCAFVSNSIPDLVLLPQHWGVCEKILNLLKVFNDATYTLSGVYYPTAHLFIVECVNIAGVFEEYESDEELQASVFAMREKWLKFYLDIPHIYLVAAVLDPRIKLEGLFDYLHVYYTTLQYAQDLTRLKYCIKNILISLFGEFSTLDTSEAGSSRSQAVAGEGSSSSRMSMGYKLLLSKQKRLKGSSEHISEFDLYLETNFETERFGSGTNFRLLDWWKEHATQYRVLSRIAQQIFSTPCSTVAVEQAFSAGGLILDDRRSRMAPSSVEAQACVDDWTKARFRQQEMDRAAESDFFDGDDGDSTTTATTGGSD